MHSNSIFKQLLHIENISIENTRFDEQNDEKLFVIGKNCCRNIFHCKDAILLTLVLLATYVAVYALYCREPILLLPPEHILI
jgi:hypothetical protein